MSTSKTYAGPVTGQVYNLVAGDRIDVIAEGIGCSGDKSSPTPVVNGQQTYKRIFVRLRTPYETLTCRPIKDSADFATRVSIIENWFNSVLRNRNVILTFEAQELTDEEASQLEKGGEK